MAAVWRATCPKCGWESVFEHKPHMARCGRCPAYAVLTREPKP